MADGTKIEWTDATWNVINGCSVTSPGCTNCYAMRLAGTRLRNHPSRAGLTQNSKAGPVWTGETRFNEKVLLDPIRWRRPRRIFVCAHGDLFHESVPNEWIDRVFAVMASARQHQFQVLTKRAERMRDYLQRFQPSPASDGYVTRDGRESRLVSDPEPVFAPERWPLPNVWLGVSVEDQARAAERIPFLLESSAAVRWLSCEPLLGPVDLSEWLFCPTSLDYPASMDPTTGVYECCAKCDYTGLAGFSGTPTLDWVVAGGESGPGSRPMHPLWARLLRDQCDAACVAFHFKQWGNWHPFDSGDLLARADAGQPQSERALVFANPGDRSGMQQHVWRVGKKAAGRHLDGQLHDGYPA